MIEMLSRLFIFSILIAANQVFAATRACPTPNALCFYGEQDPQGNIVFTIHSSADGWVGLGTGSEMADSWMYLAWRNSSGGVTVSPRRSQGYSLPGPSNERVEVIPLTVPAPAWAKIAVSFKKPASNGGIQISSTTPYLFALSEIPPAEPNNPQSPFRRHSQVGSMGAIDFTVRAASPSSPSSEGGNSSAGSSNSNSANNDVQINVSKPKKSVLETDNKEAVLVIHGVIMILAWGMSPLLGIFVARYLKETLGVWWFRVHIILMLGVTSVGTFVGMLYIGLYTPAPHFAGLHQVFGLLLGLMVFAQCVLGFVIDRLFDVHRASIPWWDKLHWWLGRGMYILSIIVIALGFRSYSDYTGNNATELRVLYSLSVVFGGLLIIFGHWKLKQQHHVQGKFVA